MKRALKIIATVLLLTVAMGTAYAIKGSLDARTDADGLIARADTLIAQGADGNALGVERLAMLIHVQDPAFDDHAGLDLETDGAGITTITQSLAKRIAFDEFQAGLAKIRQTAYALGLEPRLSKAQVLALWLDTLEMERGPEGWMTGFFEASEAIYGAAPSEISETQFLHLIAVPIAPARYDLMGEDAALDVRVARIERLLAGNCAPQDNGDVWLEGCA